MTRKAIKLAVAVVAVAAVLVPAAAFAGGSNGPVISYYTKEASGDKINHRAWGKSFYIHGTDLKKVFVWTCWNGEEYVEMSSTTISSKLVKAWGNPSCAGHTAPIAGYYTEGPPALGPDFTFTGTAPF
jgi:hypothetical protein